MNNTINVDFDIRSDLYNLYIIDNSCWGISQNLPSVIEITLPGVKKPYKDYFGKKDTAYDSISLGLNCGDSCDRLELPDGIYHVKIKASPETFYREYYYPKVDQLQRDIDLAFIANDMDGCSDNCKKDIIQVTFLLETCIAYTRRSDIKNANVKYSEAKRIIDKIVSCKNCK